MKIYPSIFNVAMKLSIILSIILFIISCDEDPVIPEEKNNSPVIFSLSVFPDVIGPQDSAIIICNAYDPDGDSLVYDWITDGRIRIKGARGDDHFLYHTSENSRVIYPKQSINFPPIDTLWIQCFVRDIKGGEDGQLVTIIKDSI